MTLLQAIFLGFIQGLTEFLPISSTAHLILFPWLFGWTFDPNAQIAFDILVQLGTLLAVIVYFAKDLWHMALAMLNGLRTGKPFESAEARLGWLVIVATIPAALIGLLFKKYFEGLHQMPVIVAAILFLAAGLIFIVEYVGKRNRNLSSLTWLDALIVGTSQALALFPGVSRSASTMSGGLVRGLERPAAARFSFLMSIPILLAAGLLAAKDLAAIPNFTALLPPLLVAFSVAAVVGFASIHWLLGYLAKHSMNIFAWYRLGFGALCLVIAFLRR
jgi:undecaprenyl-diphosphatase